MSARGRWLLGGPEPGGLFPPGSFSWPLLNGRCLGRRLPAPSTLNAHGVGMPRDWGRASTRRAHASPRPGAEAPGSLQPHWPRHTAALQPPPQPAASYQPSRAGRSGGARSCSSLARSHLAAAGHAQGTVMRDIGSQLHGMGSRTGAQPPCPARPHPSAPPHPSAHPAAGAEHGPAGILLILISCREGLMEQPGPVKV